MTFEMRQEESKLHHDLVNLLIADDDTQYFRRLTWALQFITETISCFDDVVERGVYQRENEEDEG